MTSRPSTSETAWNILADSTPQLARPAANRPPNDPRRPSSPPKVIATPSRQERDGSPGPVAQTLPDHNEFLQPADPDMRWVDTIVRQAEHTAAESRRRPLYREGLLTPERRPVVRCAICDLERDPGERDCSQCGSERVLQETAR